MELSIYIPAGGTVLPISAEAIEKKLNYLDVIDPSGLKERLDKFSMNSFIEVIDDTFARSNCTREDINYLALLHIKRSAYEYVARAIRVELY